MARCETILGALARLNAARWADPRLGVSIGAAPRLFARYHSHRNVTLIHGDAHVWNVLMPKDEQSGDVRLFDWDTWRIGVA
jgi:aminoglycoside phosphotransferase (APT) family kinase protein